MGSPSYMRSVIDRNVIPIILIYPRIWKPHLIWKDFLEYSQLTWTGKITTFMCRLYWNLEVSISWNPHGFSKHVRGLLYLYLNPLNSIYIPLKHVCSQWPLTLYFVFIWSQLESKQAGKARVTWHWGTFVPSLTQWKSNKNYIIWACVCSLRYPTCNAHEPFYIVNCGLSGIKIFFLNFLINDTIFGIQNAIIHKMCFDFLYTFFSDIFLILRRTEWDIVTNVCRSSCKVAVVLVTC